MALQERLDGNIACDKCGYNLRGLSRDGRCSECGFEVQETLRRATLIGADPSQLAVLRQSAELWCVSSYVVFGGVLMMMFGGLVGGAVLAVTTMILFLGYALMIGGAAGLYRFDIPRAGLAAMRLFVVLALSLPLSMLAVFVFGPAALIATAISGALLQLLVLRRMSQIAARVPSESLVASIAQFRAFAMVLWLLAGLVVGGGFFLSGGTSVAFGRSGLAVMSSVCVIAFGALAATIWWNIIAREFRRVVMWVANPPGEAWRTASKRAVVDSREA